MDSTKLLLNELKNQLMAVHYMGQSTQSFRMYVKYSDSVMRFIESHKLDIIAYVDTWVDNNWNSAESIYRTFWEYVNEGEEIEALRVLSIK